MPSWTVTLSSADGREQIKILIRLGPAWVRARLCPSEEAREEVMFWRGETEKGPSLQLYQSDFGRFRSPVHSFPREQSPRQMVVAPFTSSPSQGSILTLSTRWKAVPPSHCCSMEKPAPACLVLPTWNPLWVPVSVCGCILSCYGIGTTSWSYLPFSYH